jgi:hypothetical protein
LNVPRCRFELREWAESFDGKRSTKVAGIGPANGERESGRGTRTTTKRLELSFGLRDLGGLDATPFPALTRRFYGKLGTIWGERR